MTFYIVLFVSWTCPGGWFSGWVPKVVQPVVCEASPEAETYDRLDRALRRIEDLGDDAVLMECHGLKCRDKPVGWAPHT